MAINPTFPTSSETAAAADVAVDRAAESAHAMVDRVAETAGPAVARVRGSIENATERLQSGVEHIGEVQSRWVENCRCSVRDHPLASIGLAVAAGVLLDLAVNRSMAARRRADRRQSESMRAD